MSEEIEKKEKAEPKRRGRPRKTVEEVKDKVEKKETKKASVKKETKKEETTEPKRRGRPRKNVEEIKDKVEKKETKKDSTKKETKKKTEVKDKEIKKDVKKDTKKDTKKENKVKKEKEEVEEKKSLVKNDIEDLAINSEKLEKIEQEIKKQKTISVEKRKKINKKIFVNVLVAISIVLYFIFINLGYANLELEKYLIDLKVFSIVTIGITIVLFERAYKKDSGEITIFGIETLVLSIITLLTSYYCVVYSNKYPYIINCIAVLFGLYYVVKSTIIYLKMKKKALYASGDIHKIVKK